MKRYILLSLILLFLAVPVIAQIPSFEITSYPGPDISNISVSQVGSTVKFRATATDISGIYMVVVIIRNFRGNPIDSVILHDDGAHDDGAASDDVYGDILLTAGYPDGIYTVDIFAVDNIGFRRDLPNVGSFVIGGDMPPTCIINLPRFAQEDEVFPINVAGSSDDEGISKVRFASDDSQDGSLSQGWTDWFNWDTSSGDWDATYKTMSWSFPIQGSKEVWAEVMDTAGQTSYSYANITVYPFMSKCDVHPDEYIVCLNIRFSGPDITQINPFTVPASAPAGSTVNLSATLKYDNGTLISGELISFRDETDNINIGSATTNASGVAQVNYSIPLTALIGNHTLKASYAGNPSRDLLPSEKTEIMAVTGIPWACGTGTVQDGDGHTYNTVPIGSQCWMATNLNYDGNPSNNGCKDVTWVNNTDVGWCGYYTGGPFTNEGLLYQWSAATQANLCPTGWHVPTDAEYMTLEMQLGMTQAQADATGWRGTIEGDEMKKAGLCQGRTPCGTSGFNGLLAGYRYVDGPFSYRGTYGQFWSSSQGSVTYAWYRGLGSVQAMVSRYNNTKAGGYSVRCLRDTTTIITTPTITLSAATSVTATTAQLNGNVTVTGGENPTVTVYWGDNDGGQGTWDNSSAPTSPGQPQGVAAFLKSLTGLSPGTTYYFSAKATNSAGTGWPAASLSFITSTTTTATYNFVGVTYPAEATSHKGTAGENQFITVPPNPPTGTEGNQAAYDNVESANAAPYWENVSAFQGYSPWKQFRFYTTISAASMSDITGTAKGYNWQGNESGVDSYKLFIWNFTSSAWELLATSPTPTTNTQITGSKTASLSNYVSGNYIYLATLGAARTFEGVSTLYDDYVYLTVTYTNPL